MSVRMEHLISHGKDFCFLSGIFYEVVHTFRHVNKIKEISKNGARNTLHEDLRTVQHLTGSSFYN